MKKRFENLCFLLTYAWKKCKALYFASLGKAVFNALLPLIDIAGLGFVVDALVNNSPRHEVMRLILYFLLFNLAVALLSQLLTLAENIIMRKASDITQRDYMNDSIRIDYHYAQDRSILDLKKKSMGAIRRNCLSFFGSQSAVSKRTSVNIRSFNLVYCA